jgi:hypothetical protein
MASYKFEFIGLASETHFNDLRSPSRNHKQSADHLALLLHSYTVASPNSNVLLLTLILILVVAS